MPTDCRTALLGPTVVALHGEHGDAQSRVRAHPHDPKNPSLCRAGARPQCHHCGVAARTGDVSTWLLCCSLHPVPRLLPLPQAPSPLTSLCRLFLAASQPRSASAANPTAPFSAPLDSLTAAMAEGEDPTLGRSEQGILMQDPHPPDSCPGKRILLLNSLLGVFVSTPICSSKQGPGGVQGCRVVPSAGLGMLMGLSDS